MCSSDQYKIGSLQDNFRFHSEYEGILDYGGREGYYAPTTFLDGEGRRIVFGWMPETRGDYKGIQGWAGIQAIPRILSFKNNSLCMEPIPEMHKLREKEYSIDIQEVTSSVDTGISGKALELKLVTKQTKEAFWVKFFRSANGEEETVLWIDPQKEKVVLDRSKSSLYPGIHKFSIEGDLHKNPDGVYQVRIFLDYSSIEVFINKETCLSTRVYPKREDSVNVQIGSDKKLSIQEFQGWKLKATR